MRDLLTQTQSARGLVHLLGFAGPIEAELIGAAEKIATAAPFRRMSTPGGKLMSVAMTNCGDVGWITDRHGYRYAANDPQTGKAWPAMPKFFSALAERAAAMAGFDNFAPNACLMNLYHPGTRMSLHQDRDEADFSAPIVSISLGLRAVFLWGGAARSDKTARILLESGDVLVWGGAARLNFHGVAPLKNGYHPMLGKTRINLTLRKAL